MLVDDEVYLSKEVDNFLDHHGVKGQKWGIRNQHEVNKASRQRVRAQRTKEIDAARKRYKTSARSNYKQAKVQYKQDKITLGRAEARRNLQKVKDKNIKDYTVGSQPRDGKELTKHILIAAGGVALLAAGTASSYA